MPAPSSPGRSEWQRAAIRLAIDILCCSITGCMLAGAACGRSTDERFLRQLPLAVPLHRAGMNILLLDARNHGRSDSASYSSLPGFAEDAGAAVEWMMRRYLGWFRMPGFCKSWILRYAEWVIGHRYEDIAPMNTACRVQCPILLVHGTAGETVPVTDAQAIRNNCRGKEPELLLLEGGSHDSVEKVEQHGDELVAFLEKSGIV